MKNTPWRGTRSGAQQAAGARASRYRPPSRPGPSSARLALAPAAAVCGHRRLPPACAPPCPRTYVFALRGLGNTPKSVCRKKAVPTALDGTVVFGGSPRPLKSALPHAAPPGRCDPDPASEPTSLEQRATAGRLLRGYQWTVQRLRAWLIAAGAGWTHGLLQAYLAIKLVLPFEFFKQ